MTQEGGFMATIKEQIQALYDEINKTQKNKATNVVGIPKNINS